MQTLSILAMIMDMAMTATTLTTTVTCGTRRHHDHLIGLNQLLPRRLGHGEVALLPEARRVYGSQDLAPPGWRRDGVA